MRSKDYRLQTVLKIRANAKDEAGRLLSERMQELDEANAELNHRQTDLLACYEKQDRKQAAMIDLLECGTRIGDAIRHRTFLEDLRESETQLKESTEKQKDTVLRAENKLENARDKLVDATRDFKAIETHRTKWVEGVLMAAARREQKIGDEIGAILYGRSGKK